MGHTCCKKTSFGSSFGTRSEVCDDLFDPVRNKFVLIGTSRSGKSTLFKQMKINYADWYTNDNLIEEKTVILRSLIDAFKDFVRVLRQMHGGVSEDLELQDKANTLFPRNGIYMLSANHEMWNLMKSIWCSKRGQDLWANHSSLYSNTDNLEYFMNNLDRITHRDYSPNEQDFLNCYVPSANSSELPFQYKGVSTIVVDLGGTRAMRTRWMRYFDGVTAFLFVVAVNEFDNVDRIVEAKEFLKRTLKLWMFKKPVMLLLNKQDLLKQKLKQMEKEGRNLDDFFPELKAGNDYTNIFPKVQEYLKAQILSVCTDEDKARVFPYFVTAIDRTSFTKVFDSAVKQLLELTVLSCYLTL